MKDLGTPRLAAERVGGLARGVLNKTRAKLRCGRTPPGIEFQHVRSRRDPQFRERSEAISASDPGQIPLGPAHGPPRRHGNDTRGRYIEGRGEPTRRGAVGNSGPGIRPNDVSG